MTETLPISNESLARAITRRTLRESAERQSLDAARATRGYAPTRQRRGPVFRAGLRFMAQALQGRVLEHAVVGAGKRALAYWVYWEVAGEPPRPAIRLATLEARRDRLQESDLVRVSQHALQRLFQRLRTTDPTLALGELLPAARSAAHLYRQALAHGERYAVHLRVPTGLGEAVLVWEDEGFLVTTWLHRDSLTEEREAERRRALTKGELLCA